MLNTQAVLALETGDRLGYPAGFFAWITTDEGQQVWELFETLAMRAARSGRKRYGAKSIIEVLRWQTTVEDGSEFKINNNWAPGLARLWMQKHGDDYPGFFVLRDALGRDYQ